MEVAKAGLRERLDGVELRDPGFPVVSNVTAQPISVASDARQLLLEQLTSPVRWVASVEAMRAAGVEEFWELGPGNVLTGLLRRIDRAATGRALGTPREIEELLAEG
jgi:[acyl-carrier-protein] S-malonyltransferase